MLLDPIFSVGKFSFYQQVPRKSIGATVGYIAYLGLIFSLALAAAMYSQLRPRIIAAAEWAGTNLPVMSFSGGKLSSALKAPALIRHPGVKEAGLLIDTRRSEAVPASELEQKKVSAYLTQNALYLLVDRRVETFDFSKIVTARPVVVDANFYRRVADVLNQVLYPIAFVAMWVTFLIWKHISALIYSVMAVLINAAVSGGHEYPALYKIAVYAQTPVVFLQMATLFFPRPIPYFGILAFLIVGLYIWQALRQHPAVSAGLQPI